MPHLQDLWSEIGKQRGDVAILCVNVGDSKEIIADWWRKEGYTLAAVRQQDSEVSAAFGVHWYPTNYVIGPDGTIRWRAVGYDEAAIRAALLARQEPEAAAAAAAPEAQTPLEQDPEAWFQEILQRYRESAAIEAELHFRGMQEQPGGEPRLITDIGLSMRFAKPASGRILLRGRTATDQDQDGDGVPDLQEFHQELIGDGSQFFQVDHVARTVRRLGDSLEQLGEAWVDLDPFKAWAGIALQPYQKLEWLAPTLEGSTLRGLKLQCDHHHLEYWFGADGLLHHGALVPAPGLARLVPRMDFEVRSLLLYSAEQAAAADFAAAAVPGDYSPVP